MSSDGRIPSCKDKAHAGAGTADGPAVGVADLEGPLLLPHFTWTRSLSMSRPFAQASAALSAEYRSLKLMNAHLE